MGARGGEGRGILGAGAAGRKPVIVIAGPTASGKSDAALALARERPIVVVNADALQVYRDLAVLSARPDDAALARAPHRLYGVLDGAETCSAGRWREMALAEISAAHREDRLPVLVGGTGLYLKGLIEGIAPYWMIALWALFATTFNVSLRALRDRPALAALLASVGAPASYFAGARLGALEFVAAGAALAAIGIGWALLAPLMLRAAKRLDGYAPA